MAHSTSKEATKDIALRLILTLIVEVILTLLMVEGILEVALPVDDAY